MKKALLVFIGVALSISGFAQFRAGAGVTFGTEISTVGINLVGVYEITEQWEGVAAFTYFFEKDYVSWKVLDFDAHYNFYSLEKVGFFGLAGFSLNFWKIKIPDLTISGYTLPGSTTTGTSAGFNIGAGAKYNISEQLSLLPELRFTIMDGSYLRIGATVQYKF